MVFLVTAPRRESRHGFYRCPPPEYFQKLDRVVVARGRTRESWRSATASLGGNATCQKKKSDEEEADAAEDVHDFITNALLAPGEEQNNCSHRPPSHRQKQDKSPRKRHLFYTRGHLELRAQWWKC